MELKITYSITKTETIEIAKNFWKNHKDLNPTLRALIIEYAINGTTDVKLIDIEKEDIQIHNTEILSFE